jgi:hypothetical protein
MSPFAGGQMVRARHRLMARGVVAATGRMVRQALAGEWSDVSATLVVRRQLFELLQQTAKGSSEQSTVQAIRAALRESDRAFLEAACRRIDRGTAQRRHTI